MLVTEVLPGSGERTDAATPEGRAWLARRYARDDRGYVRVNMITTLTGAAAGADGTSDTLTNRVDRAILGVIRADADVVVVGAQTVRAEGYVLPRRSRLAVVSTSGNLAGHRLSLDPDGTDDQVLVILPAGAPAPPALHGLTVVRLPGEGPIAASGIVAALTGRGLRRIVCEGGPSLASQFAGAGLVDEFCVTAAPALVPAASPFLDLAERIATEPVGMLVDEDGFSYLRLQRP
ncbi:dihydrofolate reductase family protein [Microbacterium sp. 179-B 1A2 NHS]|uniref:dihydrofolate reductase family protein n=1 Tax=Microbacterium sp. 179-B 1A2 NHS TaxID=3142383 RepID=UPI0039A14AE7